MSKGFLLSTPVPDGFRTTATVYATVEEALAGANVLLDGGAEAVRIVDNEGNLILPSDQVMMRLHPSAQSTPQANATRR